jgi:phenylalanyl-tRNA synthetase beta subunit
VCDNNIEKIELIDHYYHAKKGRYSNTWRFTFSCTDPKIKNQDEYNNMCNAQMASIEVALVSNLGLEIR